MPRDWFGGTMVPTLKGNVHEGGGRMQNRTVVAAGVLGALLALGVVAGSFLMGGALVRFKMADRNVVVRGFAERNVEADLAIWPIVFQNTANDLTELQRLVDLHDAQIRGFLKAQGFEDGEISSMPPQITDRKTQPGMDPGVKLDERYMAQTAITLRSSKMGEVKVAMRKSGEQSRGADEPEGGHEDGEGVEHGQGDGETEHDAMPREPRDHPCDRRRADDHAERVERHEHAALADRLFGGEGPLHR